LLGNITRFGASVGRYFLSLSLYRLGTHILQRCFGHVERLEEKGRAEKEKSGVGVVFLLCLVFGIGSRPPLWPIWQHFVDKKSLALIFVIWRTDGLEYV